MVSIKEIKQYLEKRIGKKTTIEDIEFKLSDVLEVESQIIVIFIVNNNSLIFKIEGDNIPTTIIVDEKIECVSRYVKFESKKSFIRMLYRFLEQYAQNIEIIENNGIEPDIFVWH